MPIYNDQNQRKMRSVMSFSADSVLVDHFCSIIDAQIASKMTGYSSRSAFFEDCMRQFVEKTDARTEIIPDLRKLCTSCGSLVHPRERYCPGCGKEVSQ